MKKLALSAFAATLLLTGVAYGQAALPMQAVQAKSVVIKIDADQWKSAMFLADHAVLENGAMRLSGNVRISVKGYVMKADTAVISPELVTLEGHAEVVLSAAQ